MTNQEQKFFDQYGFMSCYECDETFVTEQTLDEHLEKCIDDQPHMKNTQVESLLRIVQTHYITVYTKSQDLI